MIQARTPKGFRDSMPQDELRRQSMITSIRNACYRMGYMPIDTPILEYSEILLGKGGGETDKQVYSFEDPGGRSLSLRYDLTVPLARFVAQHLHELPIPFRRFHVGKVFRGENPQKGRYREFYQCDWDLIADASLLGDWEILYSILYIFQDLGIEDITIHVSHRSIIASLLQKLDVSSATPEVLRIIDKRAKIGSDACMAQLTQHLGASKARDILQYISTTGTNEERLQRFQDIVEAKLYQDLTALFTLAADTKFAPQFVFDPGITRGLDYYTGLVFESFLNGVAHIGSVCSGGRYDSLTALYSNESISGIGASIGLDRLIAGLAELPSAQEIALPQRVLLCNEHKDNVAFCQSLLAYLRSENISGELYPDAKPIKKQFSYAQKAMIPFVLRIDSAQSIEIKHLASSSNTKTKDFKALIPFIKHHGAAT